MSEERYTVEHIFVQGESGPEPITNGGVALFVPLSKARTNVVRPDDEVVRSLPADEASLGASMADSVEDVCRIHDVHIRGEYVDVDGEVKGVDIPVRNERDFTISELTRRDPGLRVRYVEMRLCESLATEFDRRARGCLTDEEVMELEQLAATLEASASVEEDGR